MAGADVVLGVVFVHLPAVHNESLGNGDETGVRVHVGPLLPTRLVTSKPAEREQVEQGVQATLRNMVEEEVGVL
ncbi:hypothetical protein ACFVHR_26450 [Streptomyces sp. NPDC127168]|uniref:hypothetical protein n=1 Tax=unclassified Streptomyces TaxID=2593676 RepID=UPI00362D89E1